MARTKKQTSTQDLEEMEQRRARIRDVEAKLKAAQQRAARAPTTGFAIEITDSTELGLAMLIVETEDGHYQPVSVVATIGEAKEMARHDFASRISDLEGGGDPICPYGYRVWAQGIGGEYRTAAEIGVPRRTRE